MDGGVEGGDAERLEHDLGHDLAVPGGGERCFCEERRVVLGSCEKLVAVDVVVYPSHVVPVGDDSMGDGMIEVEDIPVGLGCGAFYGVNSAVS